jgi:hypothetical protein
VKRTNSRGIDISIRPERLQECHRFSGRKSINGIEDVKRCALADHGRIYFYQTKISSRVGDCKIKIIASIDTVGRPYLGGLEYRARKGKQANCQKDDALFHDVPPKINYTASAAGN